MVAGMLMLSLVLTGTTVMQTDTPEDTLWYARYWNNTELSGTPALSRNEVGLAYNWEQGSPGAAINPDSFSAKWTAFLDLDAGMYRFTVTADDGVRVWVDDSWIIDDWRLSPGETRTAYKTVEGGEHEVVVEYFESSGNASIDLSWQRVEDRSTDAESLIIAPEQGDVGTLLSVIGTDFAPETVVDLALGEIEEGYVIVDTVVSDEDGNLNSNLRIPPDADPGEEWAVAATLDRRNFVATSNSFIVTPDDNREDGVTVPRECGRQVIVQPGDTLFGIADRCNTTIAAILDENRFIEDASLIRVGWVLLMPDGHEVDPSAVLEPDAGPPGTLATLSVDGYPSNSMIQIGLGRARSEYTIVQRIRTNERGSIQTGVKIPTYAESSEQWVAVIQTADNRLKTISNTFTVIEP